jgi:2'-5' RNA ligase
VGPRAYYWYLTFENASELHSVVLWHQRAIAFPYYDLTPTRDLHLTLNRVAFEGTISPARLAAIEAAAADACGEISPFDISIGWFGGTRSAVGFTAAPYQPLRHLHDALLAATLSVHPQAPVRRSEFHPHVAIAYANADVPAAETVAAVERLHGTAQLRLTIGESVLVLLERRQRSYAWSVVSRIPLAG